MFSSAGANVLALHTDNHKKPSDDRPRCLENPRPAGAESTLTENVASPFHAEPRQFNKTSASNWKVAWHQDRTIAVRERKDVAAFGPWSVKECVPSVQPPSSIMAHMLAIRLHLDESHEDNGPLRVIPGSHKVGCLSAEGIATWKEQLCTVPRGGAILMRPLLVHASSSCAKPEPRRVIHLEFAVENLPGGLEWRDKG